jgi:ABC-2 type transport system permease protein
MKKFSRYLAVGWFLYSTRVGKQVSLIADSALRCVGTMSFFALHIVLTKFLLNNFRFPRWNYNEFWIFLFSFQFFYYGMFFVLWEGLKQTSFEINRGTFDFILIRPISSRFLSFVRPGQINNMVGMLSGLTLLLIFLYRFYGFSSFVIIPIYLFCVIISMWIMHCLSMMILSLNFKYPGMEHLRAVIFAVQELYKYPVSSYDGQSILLRLLIVPFSLMSTIPATLLLLKRIDLIYVLAYIAMAIVMTFFSKRVWDWGLKNYTSAS